MDTLTRVGNEGYEMLLVICKVTFKLLSVESPQILKRPISSVNNIVYVVRLRGQFQTKYVSGATIKAGNRKMRKTATLATLRNTRMTTYCPLALVLINVLQLNHLNHWLLI